MKSKAWDWKDYDASFWGEPAQDVYYLASRWKNNGVTRFLDLGCGIGRHSIFFAMEGFDVCAFDLSQNGIAKLKDEADKRELKIDTSIGDMCKLPYEDSFFNCVLAYNVIYHSDKMGTERVISEIKRVLKPGGEAYITFNSKNNSSFKNPSNKHIDENTIIKTEGNEAGIPHYYVDEEEVRRLLTDFEIVKMNHVEEIGDGWRSWHYYVLLRKNIV